MPMPRRWCWSSCCLRSMERRHGWPSTGCTGGSSRYEIVCSHAGYTALVFPWKNDRSVASRTPFIEVEQLSLHYGQKPAFHDVTLSINKGCITALVGPSGCGKTSFLTSLNRLTDLIPGCRVSGRIRLDGLDVLAPQTDVIRLAPPRRHDFPKAESVPSLDPEEPGVSLARARAQGSGTDRHHHRDGTARRGSVGRGQGPPEFAGLGAVGRPTATIMHGQSAGPLARSAPDG